MAGKGGASERFDVREKTPLCSSCGEFERWHLWPSTIPRLHPEGVREALIAKVLSHGFRAFCQYGHHHPPGPACSVVITTGRKCERHKAFDEWREEPVIGGPPWLYREGE